MIGLPRTTTLVFALGSLLRGACGVDVAACDTVDWMLTADNHICAGG